MEDKKLKIGVLVTKVIEINISEIARNVIDWNKREGVSDIDDIITEMGDNIDTYLAEAGYDYDISEYTLQDICDSVGKEIERLLEDA